MARTILSVPDISCGHCERTITNALAPLEGVRGIAVSIPHKRVHVEYDPTVVDVERMKEILADEDYPVATAETEAA
jgi:copper chaperone